MKYRKYITGALIAASLAACTEDVMDRINRDVNDPADVQAINQVPTVIVESSFGTTGTDIAWYTSVFIEHNAGTFGQLKTADQRTGANVPSLFNNNWNAIYDNLMVLKDIRDKCSPEGPEPNNKAVLGIAQVLTAYNLAIVTDMWGQVPWTEAVLGLENVQPKYDRQQDIYTQSIIPLLNEAIANLSVPVSPDIAAALVTQDLMYGDRDNDEWLPEKWIKAAWSLKARYFMHMQKVNAQAMDSVLNCVTNGFSSAEDELVFRRYENSALGENPWKQFFDERGYLSVGKTLYDIMVERNDPRINAYFLPYNASGIKPAPNGEAEDSQQGSVYSVSTFSDDPLAPTPLMTYHELKFLEAEALARKGQVFLTALRDAVAASFAYHGVNGATTYFTAQVVPRLGTTQIANLQEILTQKYIAFFEAESIEAYNDYRRTRIPQLHNPANNVASYGFIERFPYPTSEVTANPANVPQVNVFRDKIWWAGGTE